MKKLFIETSVLALIALYIATRDGLTMTIFAFPFCLFIETLGALIEKHIFRMDDVHVGQERKNILHYAFAIVELGALKGVRKIFLRSGLVGGLVAAAIFVVIVQVLSIYAYNTEDRTRRRLTKIRKDLGEKIAG